MHIPRQMSEFVRYFSGSKQTVEEADFAIFGLNGELKHFKKGECLIEQGLGAPNIYFLTTGLVRYFSVSEEGKEFTQSFSSAPGIAGSTRAMILGTEALFSIEVLDDVLCWQFEWQPFFNTMKGQPGFLEAYSRLMEQMFANKEAREYYLLQKSAEQRYLEFVDEHPGLSELVPLKVVASYIGITPIALSRIRKKLK
ncbi:Crp/Fnr family transcriptional regulator [Pseudoteredinibacter isoporae]|uniref:Crp/Fnr family transcriptional regulator n=1 Tax=Pseudoteredinibacter isoporae TaxID=570281 RepID=UPI00310661F3